MAKSAGQLARRKRYNQTESGLARRKLHRSRNRTTRRQAEVAAKHMLATLEPKDTQQCRHCLTRGTAPDAHNSADCPIRTALERRLDNKRAEAAARAKEWAAGRTRAAEQAVVLPGAAVAALVHLVGGMGVEETEGGPEDGAMVGALFDLHFRMMGLRALGLLGQEARVAWNLHFEAAAGSCRDDEPAKKMLEKMVID